MIYGFQSSLLIELSCSFASEWDRIVVGDVIRVVKTRLVLRKFLSGDVVETKAVDRQVGWL